MLRLDSVSKSFQAPSGKGLSLSEGVVAVREVNISLGAGEYASIMGASGCGKSTLLHLIAGLDAPSSGEIWFEGQPIHLMKNRALSLFRQQKLGFVFQFFNLIPQLTVMENVVLPLRILGVSPQDRNSRAREILARIGLADKAGRLIAEISGGEQQRVAIARAVIHHPRLLLADEPTGNLDTATSEIVLELLEEVRRVYGVTLLVVTHSHEVARRADRRIQMQDGRLVNVLEPSNASLTIPHESSGCRETHSP